MVVTILFVPFLYVEHMYAEFHSCGIFSPAYVALNTSVRKIITFFLQYLSNSIGVPFGPGAYCFLKILRRFLSFLLLL